MTNEITERKSTATRRSALKILSGATLVPLASAFPAPFVKAARGFRVGYVSPQTGPLAVFAEPDQFTLEQVKNATAGGIRAAGQNYPLEIIYRDSQSDSNRASEVAAKLALDDGIDLVLAASTPATTNPVADQCELNNVPCLTNDTPWQPHFFGRGGDPKVGFQWTYHFFWGLEDIIGSYTSLWSLIPTNGSVGALWPNDSDGNAWGDAARGFPPVLSKKGIKLTDPGRYQSPNDNFANYLEAFKKADVEIVTGVVPPPDFAAFWNQAGQRGFKPKIVTVAKASEFPAAIAAFGDRAEGLSVEVWWAPTYPFASGLTGDSSAKLAEAYTQATGRPWSMPLAFKHSLFEVAIDTLKRSEGPGNRTAIRDALRATSYASVVGKIDFSKGPVPNVAKTPLTAGQWKRRGRALELVVVENSQAPEIKVTDKLDPII
jgi:branched-chain amino acid transport system substrate-binding protein